MKRSLFLVAFLALAGSASVSVSFFHKGVEALADGSAPPSISGYEDMTLPQNISLRDNTAEEIRSYYAPLDGQSLSGEDLLIALKPILMNGQKYHSYDSGNGQIWKMYEITDRDWTLSPASEIDGYDPDANMLRRYIYGKPGTNPYLRILYRDHDMEEARSHAWDAHGSSTPNNGFDREHIWPKSRGFGVENNVEYDYPGARGDAHHLLPGDHYVNSTTHNNYSYGFVDRSKIKNNSSTAHVVDGSVITPENYRGTSATFGTSLGNEDVFEPQDSDKGDIARACFYMAARYNNLAGDDATIDAGNPNLLLEDTVDRTTIMSKANRPVSIGILRDLLAWHKIDPVDEFEIHRNNLIFNNYDHNRNPFIDFPEWVDYIWGTVDYDATAHKVTAHHNAPTGTAAPATDDLTTDGPVVPPSSSESSESSAQSTESSSSSQLSSEIPVPTVQSIAVANAKTTFNVGDAFSFGGTVTATYSDSSTKNVTSECDFSGYDMGKEGKQTVTVKHRASNLTTTYEITVNAAPQSFLNAVPMPVLIIIAVVLGVVIILLLIFIPSLRKKALRPAKPKPKGRSKKSTKKRK